MKRSLFFLFRTFIILAFCYSKGLGQVAINEDGSLPDASAILDIKSTTKGVLFPRMTTAQRNLLPNMAGLTVFDVTLGSLMVNSGTKWEPGGISLPYTGTLFTNSTIPIFKVLSSGTNAYSIMGETATNGIGVYGKTSTGTGILGYAESGTAGYFQSGLSTGTALSIIGKMNSNGSTGTNGSVLSINTSGNPTWQEPVAFAVNDLGAADLSVLHNTDTKFVFAAEEYDLGGDFNLATSEFTAPAKGVYHFDAFAYWNGHTNGTGYVAISIMKNGALYATTREPAIINEGVSNNIGINVLLNVGDKITCQGYQNSGVAQSIFQDGRTVKFSGYLVAKQ